MNSVAVYNYVNSGSRAIKPKYRKIIPISKFCQNKQMEKCKICRRKILRTQNKHVVATENKNQPGNVVLEKVLLIWKYTKSVLSNTVQKNYPKKCSFKIIAHKSYKKRTLHQEIVLISTSILSQICKICEKREIQKNKSKELEAEEHKINEYVLNEHKYNAEIYGKNKSKKPIKQCLIKSKIQHNKRGKKRNCISYFKNTATGKKGTSGKKIVKTKQNPKKAFLPKIKNENRIANWQYMHHVRPLSSISEENITNYVTTDNKTPVYLTFEEYCHILEAIDTRGSTTKGFRGIDGELHGNIEEDTNTRQLNISTEDIGTNTDLLFEFTEDALTNTEQLSETTEKQTEFIINNKEKFQSKENRILQMGKSKGNQSKNQLESPDESLEDTLNQKDETIENTSSENEAEEFIEN